MFKIAIAMCLRPVGGEDHSAQAVHFDDNFLKCVVVFLLSFSAIGLNAHRLQVIQYSFTRRRVEENSFTA